MLVAPWLDYNHKRNIEFLPFQIDERVLDQIGKLIIFSSDDDDADVTDNVAHIRDKLPKAQLREFHGYGHFCYEDMKTGIFPELLDAVRSED